MATKLFVGFIALVYLTIMVWGIIISGKRRNGNWFKLLHWNFFDLNESLRKIRPK